MIEFFRCIDQSQALKSSVFDAIQMIEDAWSKVSVQTITNSFKHTKIISNPNENEDNNLTTEEFINDILESQSSDILTFFKSRNQLNDYFNVDQDIETFEENEIEAASLKPSIDIIINEKNKVEIEDALNSVKILKVFYYGEGENNAPYNHLMTLNRICMKNIARKRQD